MRVNKLKNAPCHIFQVVVKNNGVAYRLFTPSAYYYTTEPTAALSLLHLLLFLRSQEGAQWAASYKLWSYNFLMVPSAAQLRSLG